MTEAPSSCTFDHLSQPEDMISGRNLGSKHMITTSAWAAWVVTSLLLRNRWRSVVLGHVTTTISCFQSCRRDPVAKLIACAQIKVQTVSIFNCTVRWLHNLHCSFCFVYVTATQRKTLRSDMEKGQEYLEGWTVYGETGSQVSRSGYTIP